jgi:hypothetical protein
MSTSQLPNPNPEPAPVVESNKPKRSRKPPQPVSAVPTNGNGQQAKPGDPLNYTGGPIRQITQTGLWATSSQSVLARF